MLKSSEVMSFVGFRAKQVNKALTKKEGIMADISLKIFTKISQGNLNSDFGILISSRELGRYQKIDILVVV